MTRERRTSRRFAVPSARKEALLRVDHRDVPVFVQNESAGGFSIRGNAGIPAAIGQIVLLRTASGWHKVRVARKEERGRMSLAGLERIEDIPGQFKGAGILTSLLAGGRQRALSWSYGPVLFGLALVALVSLSIFYWQQSSISAWLSKRDGKSMLPFSVGPAAPASKADRPPRYAEQGPLRTGTRSATARTRIDLPPGLEPQSGFAGGDGQGPALPAHSAEAAPLSKSPESHPPAEPPREDVWRSVLKDPSFHRQTTQCLWRLRGLTLPDTAEKLRLSGEQQAAIVGICREALRNLADWKAGAQRGSSRDFELAGRALARATAVLNVEQKKQWRATLDAAPSHSPAAKLRGRK